MSWSWYPAAPAIGVQRSPTSAVAATALPSAGVSRAGAPVATPATGPVIVYEREPDQGPVWTVSSGCSVQPRIARARQCTTDPRRFDGGSSVGRTVRCAVTWDVNAAFDASWSS